MDRDDAREHAFSLRSVCLSRRRAYVLFFRRRDNVLFSAFYRLPNLRASDGKQKSASPPTTR